MSDHKYILQPYKGPGTRHACPSCGKRKCFSRYINSCTGNELADHVGRCDHEINCGYHFKPKEFFAESPGVVVSSEESHKTPQRQTNIDHLPLEIMERSVSRKKECDLFPFLTRLFTSDIADQLCNDYFIGTNKEGNTAFWQVDISGNVRQCKIIQYMPDGHRNRSKLVKFAGKEILKNQEANLKQCFFGEFLLSFAAKEKPIAIVESEKTAAIASIYFPDFIWLATGGIHGAKWSEQSVCNVLNGRKLILFPDLGAFNQWKSKSLLLASVAGCKVVVSDLIEKAASDEDRVHGFDIADYLLRTEDSSGLALTDHQYPVIWDYKNKPVLIESES